MATSTAINAAAAAVAAITTARRPVCGRVCADAPIGQVAVAGRDVAGGGTPAGRTAAIPARHRVACNGIVAGLASVTPRPAVAPADLTDRRAAATIAAADGYRCAGHFAIPVVTTSRTATGTSSGNGAGVPWTCASATATAFSPVNGGTPAKHSYAKQASA
jgi:hypothetical protein